MTRKWKDEELREEFWVKDVSSAKALGWKLSLLKDSKKALRRNGAGEGCEVGPER